MCPSIYCQLILYLVDVDTKSLQHKIFFSYTWIFTTPYNSIYREMMFFKVGKVGCFFIFSAFFSTISVFHCLVNGYVSGEVGESMYLSLRKILKSDISFHIDDGG